MKMFLSAIFMVSSWILIGKFGQNVLEIESFPYIMAWGSLTAIVVLYFDVRIFNKGIKKPQKAYNEDR